MALSLASIKYCFQRQFIATEGNKAKTENKYYILTVT